VLVPVVAAGRPVGGGADAFEIKDRRFAAFILANAPVEELATGFRWLEGPVWFGDANCLLFQDLPGTARCVGARKRVCRSIVIRPNMPTDKHVID
jgi:hypothetical protein